MSVSPKQFLVRVCAKADTREEFEIPAHRFDGKRLDEFLRAIVINHQTTTAEEMTVYYVNGRAGLPKRNHSAEVSEYFNYESRRCGRWCGDWEFHAYATFDISAAWADEIQKLLDQNQRARANANPNDELARIAPRAGLARSRR